MAFPISFFGILEQAGEAHKKLLEEAYQKGREAGRAEAVAEFKASLAGLTDKLSGFEAAPVEAPSPQPAPVVKPMPPTDRQPHRKRAAAGSVKPAIYKLVTERPGISTRELEQATGFKLNSIRGTIWTLQQEKAVERRDEGIYPVAQKDEAAGTVPEKDAPTASVTEADAGNGAGLFTHT